MASSLSADQRAGVTEVELPLAPGSRLHDAFAARIDSSTCSPGAPLSRRRTSATI
jgi:hypothetical protein